MPFNPPYRLKFHKGDLVYGLSDPRAVLCQHIGVPYLSVHHIVDTWGLLQQPTGAQNAAAGLKFEPGLIAAMQAYGNPHYGKATGRLVNSVRNYDDGLSRIKCKGALDYITRYEATRHIHFCLDGLDMEAVAGKSYTAAEGGVPDGPGTKRTLRPWLTKQRSITGAELRWIYRNRQDNRVADKVQFWLGKDPVPPPWVAPHAPEWLAAWALYAPKKEWNG
jgi:hypothetical protein